MVSYVDEEKDYLAKIERERPHQAKLFKILDTAAEESRAEGGSRCDLIFAMRDMMYQLYYYFDNDGTLLQVEAALEVTAADVRKWIVDAKGRSEALGRARAVDRSDASLN